MTIGPHEQGASTGLGKVGVGGGAWVGAGLEHSYTYTTPTIKQMWDSAFDWF